MNLFDTDVIVELLRKRKYKPGALSIVTLIELLRGLETKKRTEVKKLIEESFNLLTIDNKVIKSYCELYQNLKEEGVLIPDADLLIAATAIAHNIPLETKDKHFQRLENLGLKLAERHQEQK
ncbi:PIN domain-containing protein [Candidatus Bathyarchaeota archaeon]|nr:type II toxin-antitoxin system VapC family toxin [Candidatus Bathyarchaeota archaeon]NIR12713.1 type II toxin-antitoxin system VapC family toxin [Desulfobacterales bacterium]NIU80867.1 PIN domain-containing protein [Candidatus Bathyarchaeota archaeon]NIV67797.1 PIN domain-containing protein [Candidatus Bathyarchaeota archaeon]NIW34205.1 PIN domain-containing protein [Candidatus Bathyarchaeota archaeon]